MRGLDTYEITIDGENSEDLGINLISFVKNPAIMVKGMAFNNQKPLRFSNDEIKMRIVAPAIIPMEIYRLSENSYEYNVKFTTEVIEKIRDKFMANLGSRNVFNLEHTEEMVPAYILETWIVGSDNKADRAYSEFGIEVPSGTLMIMSQITDKDYYDGIVKNEQWAYSIEGFFNLNEIKLMINKKREIEMTEDLRLPDGEFKFGENIYTILDGKVVDIKAEEVKPEEEIKAEEVVKEEEEIKAEEVVEETVEEEVKAEEIVEEETKLAIDETELMTILQPKFDEIYKMIADLKAEEAVDEAVEGETPSEEVQMTINERFSNVYKFLKKK